MSPPCLCGPGRRDGSRPLPKEALNDTPEEDRRTRLQTQPVKLKVAGSSTTDKSNRHVAETFFLRRIAPSQPSSRTICEFGEKVSLWIVIGGQFGSEGKGKVSAHITRAEGIDICVRCGGPNWLQKSSKRLFIHSLLVTRKIPTCRQARSALTSATSSVASTPVPTPAAPVREGSRGS